MEGSSGHPSHEVRPEYPDRERDRGYRRKGLTGKDPGDVRKRVRVVSGLRGRWWEEDPSGPVPGRRVSPERPVVLPSTPTGPVGPGPFSSADVLGRTGGPYSHSVDLGGRRLLATPWFISHTHAPVVPGVSSDTTPVEVRAVGGLGPSGRVDTVPPVLVGPGRPVVSPEGRVTRTGSGTEWEVGVEVPAQPDRVSRRPSRRHLWE